MKHLLLIAAAAAVGSIATANATMVTFESFGQPYPLYAVPPGETLYTDFAGGVLPPGASGTGMTYTTVLGANYSVSAGGGKFYAPPWKAPGATPNPTDYVKTPDYFFAVLAGQNETFKFKSAVNDVGIYLGSLDSGNEFWLNLKGGGSELFTGSALGLISGAPNPLPSGTPTITGANTNGRFIFKDVSNDILSITVAEVNPPAYNSFEVAQISTSTISAPESSTWAMMAVGFVGLGFAGFHARRTARAMV